MKFSIKNMRFSIRSMKFSVYEPCKKRVLTHLFFLFVTEFSNHMYRKNAVFNGKQKHMKPLFFWACSFHARTGKSINNLLSYCGLAIARLSASEKDLPVKGSEIKHLVIGFTQIRSVDSVVILVLIKSEQHRFLLQQNVVPRECHFHGFTFLCFEARILCPISSGVFDMRPKWLERHIFWIYSSNCLVNCIWNWSFYRSIFGSWSIEEEYWCHLLLVFCPTYCRWNSVLHCNPTCCNESCAGNKGWKRESSNNSPRNTMTEILTIWKPKNYLKNTFIILLCYSLIMNSDHSISISFLRFSYGRPSSTTIL